MRPTSAQHCDFVTPAMKKLADVYDKWEAKTKNHKVISDPDAVFHGLAYSEFKQPLEHLTFKNDLTKGDVKGLSDRLDNILTAADNGDLGGKFVEMFYTPESFAKKDPMIGNLMNKYLHTTHYYKGKEELVKNEIEGITKLLEREQGARNLLENGPLRFGKKYTRQSAQAKLEKLNEEMRVLGVEAQNGNRQALLDYRRLQRQEQDLILNSELAVNAEFIGYIESGLPKLINKIIGESVEARKKSKKDFPNEPSKWVKARQYKVDGKNPFLSK